MVLVASLPPPEGLPSGRRALALRCRQYPGRHSRSLPHLVDSRTYLSYPSGDVAEKEQKITGYLPADDGLKKACTGADVCIIPAGIPRS